jgi:dipeptidyl aminopeptidase/acylaminoacyl peptidase
VLLRLVDRRFVRGWVSVAVLVALCAVPGSAWASFPGRNGAIVYGWSGEGTYRGGPTATSIRAVDPRSGRVRVLRDCPLRSDVPVQYTDCSVYGPRYSPDGLRIAFPSARTGLDSMGHPSQSERGLTTMASDGTGLEFYATGHVYSQVAWAPTGDRLLLVRSVGSIGPNASFLASLDGTELGQITPESTREPDWSSRGQIAFTRSADPCPGFPGCDDIYVTRLGGTPRRLTYRGGHSPSWSPHGKKLAFVRSVSGRGEVFLVGRDGRGLRRLTYRGGYSPAWSPDGRWIAFIRNGDLHVVRTNGRGLRRLVDAPFEELVGTSLDWQALPPR